MVRKEGVHLEEEESRDEEGQSRQGHSVAAGSFVSRETNELQVGFAGTGLKYLMQPRPGKMTLLNLPRLVDVDALLWYGSICYRW